MLIKAGVDKKITLEYIAGFVDGEGTFTILNDGHGTFRPRFSIVNTDLQVLNNIKKFFHINTKIYTKDLSKQGWQTIYRLVVGSIDDCKMIASALEPHLRLKKEHAQIMMQFPRARVINIGGRILPDFSYQTLTRKLHQRIMELNKRGAENKELSKELKLEPDMQMRLWKGGEK